MFRELRTIPVSELTLMQDDNRNMQDDNRSMQDDDRYVR